MLAAHRAVEGSEADTLTAGQRPNPSLSINTSQIEVPHGATRNGLDTVLRIDQPIERGDKRALRLKAARQAVDASQADLADVVRQARLAVDLAYYDLLLAQERQRIQIEVAALFDKSVRAGSLQLKAGAIAPNDLNRLQLDAGRANNDVRQAAAEVDKASATLAILLGLERDVGGVRAADTWPEPDAVGSLDGDTWIAGRPDVKAAQARVQLALTRREQARALQTRDVSVGVQYERLPPSPANTLGIGVSIPLFTNYRFEGELRRAEVDYATAQDALEKVQAVAFVEFSKARSDLLASAEKSRRFRDVLLDKARKSAVAAELAYRKGASSVLDLLDARRTLRAVELDTVSAQADFAKSLSALRAATANE